jgi:hypothetical protein
MEDEIVFKPSIAIYSLFERLVQAIVCFRSPQRMDFLFATNSLGTLGWLVGLAEERDKT